MKTNTSSGCVWCDEGNPAIRSSVSDAFVHTRTDIGRVVCKRERYDDNPAASFIEDDK
jgi:hypothetical protein